jgi:DNA-binding NarL/FixJ family response regulator
MSDLHAEITKLNQGPSPAEDIAKLTQRERAVIAFIAEGLKNKQIAERMFISETTVSHHLTSIFTKLGVTDRLELVIYAFGHGLAKVPR